MASPNMRVGAAGSWPLAVRKIRSEEAPAPIAAPAVGPRGQIFHAVAGRCSRPIRARNSRSTRRSSDRCMPAYRPQVRNDKLRRERAEFHESCSCSGAMTAHSCTYVRSLSSVVMKGEVCLVASQHSRPNSRRMEQLCRVRLGGRNVHDFHVQAGGLVQVRLKVHTGSRNSHTRRVVCRAEVSGIGSALVAGVSPVGVAGTAVASAFAKLLATCTIGALGVPAEQRDGAARGLSSAAFNVLFPALLFTTTARVVHEQDAALLQLALSAAVLQIGVGGAAGQLTTSLVQVNGRAKRETVVASAFGNATTIPLLLLSSLSGSLPSLQAIEGAEESCAGFLSLYQLGWSICLWTIGARYLEGDTGHSAESDYKQVGIDMLLRLASPPSIASLSGAAVGTQQAVYTNIFEQQNLLVHPAIEAIDFLGSGAQPALAMVLALSLMAPGHVSKSMTGDSQSPSLLQNETLLRQLVASIAARGLIVPSVTALAFFAGLSKTQDVGLVLSSVLLLEGCVPSAQVLVLLAQQSRNDLDEDDSSVPARIAKFLLLQYLLMLPLTALWASYFLGKL